MGVLQDKVDRLLTINEAKIVLIGNSNVAFGFDSEYIEREIGMPVVNMGYDGALGNTFHDNMIDYNVHEGDIYVIAHTSYWNKGEIDEPLSAWVAVENHPVLWHLVKQNDYMNMFRSFPAYLKKCITNHNNLKDLTITEGIYSRAAFNEYGDIEIYRTHKDVDYGEIWAPVVLESEVDDLNNWNRYLEESGAKMVVTSLPIIYDQWPISDEEMDKYQYKLEESLDCDVISNWRDYTYSTEYFYDTQYHLTSEGAEVRTIQFVNDLKTWLNLQY